MHVTQKKLAGTVFSVRWVIRKLGHMGLLAALHVSGLFALYMDKGSQLLFKRLPCLSGRWVLGIPRGFHCGQPAPR